MVLHAADATSMPAGGCHTRYVCPYIDDLATATITDTTYTDYTFIGDYQGLFNDQGGQFEPHQRGSGPVNYERYTEVGTIFDVVKGVYGDTLQECCRACARSTYCYEWHWLKNPRLAGENANVQCYLLEKNGGLGTSGSFKTPYAGDAATQVANSASYPLSFVEGLCNGTALVKNDLHLTGAHGTHYDFTGRLGKSFCLFSDRRFHVNMHLNVYQGAPPALPASLKSIAEEKEGPFDVDQFQVRVAGLGELDVRVRVAHPLLQTPTEAEAHFNVELSDVAITSAVHGVLGQTFRTTPEQLQRAVKYSHLAALLHHPVDVDKAEGKGFQDGDVEDYISSSIVAPDCKYASYASGSA
ncbi:unnamed protein product [Closterium sp. NIES-64]|nr:unnamed protein product [Closterium sp. NIES-64]